MRIEHKRRVAVPVYDTHTGEPAFDVIVYGVGWRDLCVIPGGSDPVMKAVKRLGLSPFRYQPNLFNLGPRREIKGGAYVD